MYVGHLHFKDRQNQGFKKIISFIGKHHLWDLLKISDTSSRTCWRACRLLRNEWSHVTMAKCEENNEVDESGWEDSAGDGVETDHAPSPGGCPCLTGSGGPLWTWVCLCVFVCPAPTQTGQGHAASKEMTKNMNIKI